MKQLTGTFVENQLYSKLLDEKLDLITYLPPAYSPLYKYNLLIAQDGHDYFNLGRIARLSDELHYSSLIEKTIIIGIPYKSIHDRRSKYHPDGCKHKQYVKFLAHELVPFLDEKYPTFQMGSTRALIGDSLGGTVSLIAALTYPHTFGKVIIQSPLVNNEVIHAVKKFPSPYLLDIYQVVGKNETDVKTTNGEVLNFLSSNRQLYQQLTNHKFNVIYEEFAGDHSWTYWQSDLKQALQSMLHI